MGTREDELKMEIERLYGSIPKFCRETGIAKSTIYNIFDRGIQNTRTKTMETVYAFVRLDPVEQDAPALDDDEQQLVDMFRKMDAENRARLLDVAGALVAASRAE